MFILIKIISLYSEKINNSRLITYLKYIGIAIRVGVDRFYSSSKGFSTLFHLQYSEIRRKMVYCWK